MSATRFTLIVGAWVALSTQSGCLSTGSQVSGLKTKNAALADRVRAQQARIENIEVHSRNTEDQLIRTEEDLALLEEQSGLDRKQLANLYHQRDRVQDQFQGMLNVRRPVSARTRGQLAKISQRYGNLFFDPATGVSKFDTDVLFDDGDDSLKPGAKDVLRRLAAELKSPEGQDLKVVIVGHTDDRLIAKKPVREKYADNFRLSTARAHTIGDTLRNLGLAHERMIIVGAGPHQPVAPSTSEEDRRKNRRVEIFVLGPDVPVIGWTESIPSLYRGTKSR
jgi:chemotaxis protein MotB